MNGIEIKPMALLISFIIWLDIDITICRNFAKNKYRRKSEKFKEKAKAEGNYVIGRKIELKYKSSWRDRKRRYHEGGYTVTYEYIVNGKKYEKKLRYKNNKYPLEQNIYYIAGNPRNSIAETERKNGFIYTMLSISLPFSIFIGIPLLSWWITILINMF